MTPSQIAKILTEWWNDEKTCSGRPHCCIEECDLCVNCFQDLCERLGCTWNLDNQGDKVVVSEGVGR